MKFLVIDCLSGLGNRIRALTSAQRVARKMDRSVFVQWTIDAYHCGCHFEALFDTPHAIVNSLDFTGLTVESYDVRGEPNFIRQTDADVVVVREQNFFWIDEDRGKSVVWGQYAPRKADLITEELLNEFRALKPSGYVSGRVDDFWETNFAGYDVAAVHIRREDNDWSRKFCTDEMFCEAIRNFIDSSARPRILLSTDGPQSRDCIRRRFSPYVFEYPVRSLDRGGNYRAVQDAFITMLLMSRCQAIIRSSSSSFSQCSAWFGDIRAIDIGLHQHLF